MGGGRCQREEEDNRCGLEAVNLESRDYDEMGRHASSIQWDLELVNLGVEDSWCFIKCKLLEMTESLVPMTKKRGSRAPP